jgi:hypothetical protein
LSGRQDSRFLSGCRRFGVTNGLGRNRRAEERFQQLGDAGAIHGSRLQIVDGQL